MVSLKAPRVVVAETCKVKVTFKTPSAGIVLPSASHDKYEKVKLLLTGVGGYTTMRSKGPVAPPVLVNTLLSV